MGKPSNAPPYRIPIVRVQVGRARWSLLSGYYSTSAHRPRPTTCARCCAPFAVSVLIAGFELPGPGSRLRHQANSRLSPLADQRAHAIQTAPQYAYVCFAIFRLFTIIEPSNVSANSRLRLPALITNCRLLSSSRLPLSGPDQFPALPRLPPSTSSRWTCRRTRASSCRPSRTDQLLLLQLRLQVQLHLLQQQEEQRELQLQDPRVSSCVLTGWQFDVPDSIIRGKANFVVHCRRGAEGTECRARWTCLVRNWGRLNTRARETMPPSLHFARTLARSIDERELSFSQTLRSCEEELIAVDNELMMKRNNKIICNLNICHIRYVVSPNPLTNKKSHNSISKTIRVVLKSLVRTVFCR